MSARAERIVHVSSVHRADDARVFEKECTSLAEVGYQITLVATGEAPEARFPVVALRRSERRLVRMTNGTLRAVLQALRRRPQIVHLHDPELIPWIPVFRALRIKVIFDSHEDISASMSYKPYLGKTGRRAAELGAKLLVGFADRTANGIIAATPSIAASFKNSNTAIVQNFPVLEDWVPSPSPPPGHPRFVYVGALSVERGALQMLDLIHELGRSHGAVLTLAGWADESLMESMRAHPGWKYVDFVGVVDRDGVSRLLSHATIGIVLFQPSPNHVSSQPTKLFEYMAAGLPVLASDYPLWRTLISDRRIGVVVDPTDVPAIVRGALRLLEDPALAHQMGLAGRFAAESEHDWRNEAEVLISLYDRISPTPSRKSR